MPGQAIPVKPGRTGITEDMYYWALAAAAAAVAVYFGVSGDTVTSTPGVLSTIGILFLILSLFPPLWNKRLPGVFRDRFCNGIGF